MWGLWSKIQSLIPVPAAIYLTTMLTSLSGAMAPFTTVLRRRCARGAFERHLLQRSGVGVLSGYFGFHLAVYLNRNL